MEKAKINLIKSLCDKKYRNQEKLFVGEGIKIVKDLLENGMESKEILYTDKLISDDVEYIKGYSKGELSQISEKDMSRISKLKTPTNILALFTIKIDVETVIPTDDIIVVLDGVSDPGNLGTIVRLADWYGIRNIVCSHESVDIYNPKVIQATMGAIARVNVFYRDLVQYLSEIKGLNIPIYTTALNGSNIYSEKLHTPSVVVLGNEGQGVTKPVFELSDKKLFIPPYKQIGSGCESLNVGVATAIICSEFRRNILKNQ